MRILIATHFYPPNHVGGTEVLTRSLARSLRDAGHQVQIVCAEDWASASDYRIVETDDLIDEVPVRRFRFNWTKAPDVFRYLYDNPEVAHHFDKLIEAFRPDVVHVTSCYTLSASILAMARRRGLPIVLSATDFWFLCARNTLVRSDDTLCNGPESPWMCARCMASEAKVYRWPRRLLPEPIVKVFLNSLSRLSWFSNRPGLRGFTGDWEMRLRYMTDARSLVDYTVTASDQLRNLFISYGMPSERIAQLSYGLDTSWAEGYRSKTASSKLRIGFIGQILPAKGPDLLLKAIAHLPRDLPLEVKIYGDLQKSPHYGRTLQALAGDDPRITFPGVFENNLMGQVLSEIDVLAVPSTWFDFPLVIPSAFATGTPVLTTNLPGMNELVVHERSGLLVERHDWLGLATAVRRLVDDPDLLPRLRAGIQRVKTVQEMTVEYLNIYTALLAGALPTHFGEDSLPSNPDLAITPPQP